MSSDYIHILQLTPPVTPHRLEAAYSRSCLRYQRLTATGPLRFYRERLLNDAERAYHMLKRSASSLATAPQTLRACPVAQRKAQTDTPNMSNMSNMSEPPRIPDTANMSPVQIEDAFCREVIYRLEGDLIRYDSRQELLRLARQAGMHLFRANMLMAQIVESVRQHGLGRPGPQETQLYDSWQYDSRTQDSKTQDTGTQDYRQHTKRWPTRRFILASGAALALIVDLVLILWLGH